ncbi:MAG: ABC transporter ATP-binding protein [Pseudomonadota bacterium]
MSIGFSGVSHRYDDVSVLRDVDLLVERGEILCLLGASGSGKSTLLKLAAGLEALQVGEITLDGATLATPAAQPPPEDRPVGLVFQDHVLFPHLTVLDNVGFGLHRLDATERERRARAQLQRVGLDGYAARYPHTLSGGQQQRVALARALAPEPSVLLLDEPFASIDTVLRRELRATTRTALKASDTTALLVTHDPEEALDVADRIAVLGGGGIEQLDSPEQIWRQPATRGVAALFGGSQFVGGDAANGRVRCALGEFARPVDDGPVEVWFRPSDLEIAEAAPNARLEDLRFDGSGYLLSVTLNAAAAQTLRLRVAERPATGAGAALCVRLREDNLFVFPRSTHHATR